MVSIINLLLDTAAMVVIVRGRFLFPVVIFEHIFGFYNNEN